jgi:hypothetical protein
MLAVSHCKDRVDIRTSKLARCAVALLVAVVLAVPVGLGASAPQAQAASWGWQHAGERWWYATGESWYTGWHKVGGVWYLFDGDGWMRTGWAQSGDAWYYLADSGAMKTGWFKVGDAWYYANSSGKMLTGWVSSGSHWYFLDASGAMLTGTHTISGFSYTFDASGALVGNGSALPSDDNGQVRQALTGIWVLHGLKDGNGKLVTFDPADFGVRDLDMSIRFYSSGNFYMSTANTSTGKVVHVNGHYSGTYNDATGAWNITFVANGELVAHGIVYKDAKTLYFTLAVDESRVAVYTKK